MTFDYSTPINIPEYKKEWDNKDKNLKKKCKQVKYTKNKFCDRFLKEGKKR